MNSQKIHNLIQPTLDRFSELEKMLSSALSHKDPLYAACAKEHSELLEKVYKINEWKELNKEMAHLTELIHSSDIALQNLARAEKDGLQKKLDNVEEEILQFFYPKNPNDDKNIVLEIRAGAGGEEASLFAQELGRMYLRFAERHGFRSETVSVSLSDRSGFKEAIFFIEGKSEQKKMGPFAFFKFERGVHRVQRVPVTEASGRIHTSTVTVAVLPEVEDVDVQIRPEDLRIDTYRASGHGGQHLQKTDSAVRITHAPTGIVVQCQDERSQQRNREKAMKLLRTKLHYIAQENQNKQIADDRKKQVGTGERSEKIRTYNFPQDRITDHRVGLSVHHIQEVLDGNLDSIVEALQIAEAKDMENKLEQ